MAFPQPAPVVCDMPEWAPRKWVGMYYDGRVYIRERFCRRINAFASTRELTDVGLDALLVLNHEQSHHRWRGHSEGTTDQHAIEMVGTVVLGVLPHSGCWRFSAPVIARAATARARILWSHH